MRKVLALLLLSLLMFTPANLSQKSISHLVILRQEFPAGSLICSSPCRSIVFTWSSARE